MEESFYSIIEECASVRPLYYAGGGKGRFINETPASFHCEVICQLRKTGMQPCCHPENRTLQAGTFYGRTSCKGRRRKDVNHDAEMVFDSESTSGDLSNRHKLRLPPLERCQVGETGGADHGEGLLEFVGHVLRAMAIGAERQDLAAELAIPA